MVKEGSSYMLLIEEREFEDLSPQPFDLPSIKIMLRVDNVAVSE